MDNQTTILRLVTFYVCLVAICTSPIWLCGYFINQDGAAHANNASIMIRLLQGDAQYTEFYRFNTFALPNSIGHWLLAGLLVLVSPYAATKIMIIGIFAATVAAAGTLRYQTAGFSGVRTSMIVGAAVSFNWLWLVGLYNFCIGVCIVIFAIAIFVKWRNGLTWRRVLVFAFLLLLAYFSHLIAAAALAGTMILLAIFSQPENRKMTLSKTMAAIAPLLPLGLIYRSVATASDMAFAPTWRSLSDPTSPANWINQLRTADSFIVISRKAFPFVESYSAWFTLFTPIVWISGALVVFGVATFLARRDNETEIQRVHPEYLIILGLFLVAAIFGPDDFGSEHGGVLRQRILIIGLLFFIPIFRFGENRLLKTAGNILLFLVIAFQIFALWDYSYRSDAVGREFVSAQNAIPSSGGIASITVIDNAMRYNSSPVIMINNLNGIGRSVIVWDNYELGHYLFPVVLRRHEDKEFTSQLTRNSALLTDVQEPRIAEKLAELDNIFQSDERRIQTLLVWGKLPDLDVVLMKHFESKPLYQSQNIRLFQRNQIVNDGIDGN